MLNNWLMSVALSLSVGMPLTFRHKPMVSVSSAVNDINFSIKRGVDYNVTFNSWAGGSLASFYLVFTRSGWVSMSNFFYEHPDMVFYFQSPVPLLVSNNVGVDVYSVYPEIWARLDGSTVSSSNVVSFSGTVYDFGDVESSYNALLYVFDQGGYGDNALKLQLPYGLAYPPGSWSTLFDDILITNNLLYAINPDFDADYLLGIEQGKEIGYDDGYADGLDFATNGSMFSWVTALFGAVSNIFNVQIFKGFTVGSIALIMIVFSLVPFILGLFTKGGK